jgi:hypothetical protein
LYPFHPQEFFNEMDEGHPLKLARVACGLSTTLPELGELIKAQFYKLCPLTVPKAAELGLSGEEFLADMGFKQKVSTMSWAAVVATVCSLDAATALTSLNCVIWQPWCVWVLCV